MHVKLTIVREFDSHLLPLTSALEQNESLRSVCCILMMISIIIIIIIQADCRFWYEQISFFQSSTIGDTRRATQFIRTYANHTMLTSPAARCNLQRLRSQLIYRSRPKLIRSDPKNSTVRLYSRLFKILKFSGPSLPGMTSPTHSIYSNGASNPISCLGVYNDMIIVISFPRGHASTPS